MSACMCVYVHAKSCSTTNTCIIICSSPLSIVIPLFDSVSLPMRSQSIKYSTHPRCNKNVISNFSDTQVTFFLFTYPSLTKCHTRL